MQIFSCMLSSLLLTYVVFCCNRELGTPLGSLCISEVVELPCIFSVRYRSC